MGVLRGVAKWANKHIVKPVRSKLSGHKSDTRYEAKGRGSSGNRVILADGYRGSRPGNTSNIRLT